MILADTGARPKEICNLNADDIILDQPIPYILIRSNGKTELKTSYSKRVIPLVGYALDGAKLCPLGFDRYFDKSDNLSATLNKYLKENDLLPTDKHSLYSLRHSFQDRMNEVNMTERIQCELFGHKYKREKYGSPSLELKYDWTKKIALK